jgi:type II secretory pathway pseudopilin PulG
VLRLSARRCGGFTLVEVVMSTALASLMLGGVVYGYLLAAQRAEWAAYSLAAQSLASMRVEQARSTKWDPMAWPPADELQTANFPTSVEVLDIPVSGTNLVYATNYTTISTVSAAPPLRMIRVDCVWRFYRRGLYTNTVVTYRGPDQ